MSVDSFFRPNGIAINFPFICDTGGAVDGWGGGGAEGAVLPRGESVPGLLQLRDRFVEVPKHG